MNRSIVIWLALWAGGCARVFAAAPPPPARPADVVAHLEQTIAWYRFVETTADSTATDVFQRDSIRQDALSAVRVAFQFAQAEAALLARPANAAGSGSSEQPAQNTNLQQAAARAADRVNSIQSQIHDLDASLEKAPARTRDTLTAQRNALQAELGLAKEVQSTVQDLIRFAGVQDSGGGPAGELTAEINQLELTVPEIMPQKTPASPAPAPAISSNPPAAAQAFHPESAGIFSLFGELFTLVHTRSQLKDALTRTDDLVKNINRLRAPLVSELRQEIKQGETLATGDSTPNAQEFAASQQQIQTLTARFKQVAAATIPLGEQSIVAGTARGSLAQLREAVGDQYGSTVRYLLIRLGLLIAAIVAVLIVSQFWRRATFRYIRDPRRRRQFLVLRRLVVTSAIGLVIILSFITEFGSLATYAGLLTAGIAVALQNVILSVVAYFFLIGRYGVRIGDRITISGVTGNVVDIGLVRIYLMEMVGSGADLHATGRVVVFSNSVLFQPSALFKQMPGTDYSWHTVKVSLTADSDFQTAQEHLSAAADAVYAEYRDSIEQQHAAFERSVDIQVAAPKPECRLRFSEGALEVTVHYPVPLQQASQTDERVMKALYDAIAREPKLKLMPSGAPQLVTV